jgi:hypothetical protein
MKSLPMTAFVLFAGASALGLAATIEPLMLSGSICGRHGLALAEHCWRCGALAADLVILIAAAFQQILPKTARH